MSIEKDIPIILQLYRSLIKLILFILLLLEGSLANLYVEGAPGLNFLILGNHTKTNRLLEIHECLSVTFHINMYSSQLIQATSVVFVNIIVLPVYSETFSVYTYCLRVLSP